MEVDGTPDNDLQEGAAGVVTPVGAQEGDVLGI